MGEGSNTRREPPTDTSGPDMSGVGSVVKKKAWEGSKGRPKASLI